MFFLPGTFLAALFSAPLWDWGDGGVIKKRFWIYWVITVPATGLVLGCWRAWYRFEEWRSWNGEGKRLGKEVWRWVRDTGTGGEKEMGRGRGRGSGSGNKRLGVDVEMGERWGSWGYEVGKEG